MECERVDKITKKLSLAKFLDKNVTTTTTAILQVNLRQLRTGGYGWCKVLLPACP